MDRKMCSSLGWGQKTIPKKPEVMQVINQFRAKICYDMKDAHGKQFKSYEECRKFMEEACRPGGDLAMDGDTGERSSHHGYCKEYFPESEVAAKKIAEKITKKEEEIVEESKQQIDSDKASEGADAKGQAAKAKEGAPAPSPASISTGGPAPAPAPVAYPADEAWYFKNGGKDAGRYHMNEKLKLPVHGFWGKLVGHDDMKTSSADWHAEFGDSKDIAGICKDHPDNPWCQQRGLKPSKSGAPLFVNFAALMLLLATVTASLI